MQSRGYDCPKDDVMWVGAGLQKDDWFSLFILLSFICYLLLKESGRMDKMGIMYQFWKQSQPGLAIDLLSDIVISLLVSISASLILSKDI